MQAPIEVVIIAVNETSNIVTSRIRRLAKYFKAGTLAQAFDFKLQVYRKNQRERNWERAKRKNGLYSHRLTQNTRIMLDPTDKLCQWIYNGGFETSEREFVLRFLRQGDIFIDIGAHIGLFTLIGAEAMCGRGLVYSFEPCLGTFSLLEKNVRLNRLTNVRCVNAAISDRVERRTMTVSEDGYGAWNSFGTPGAGKSFRAETVECTTLDEFASSKGLIGKVTLVKIDVEGWEMHALSGARNLLTREDAPDLLVEFTEENALNAGEDCRALYEKLCEYGYSLFRIDSASQRLYPDPPRDNYPYMNLLATKRVRFAMERTGYLAEVAVENL